MERRRREHRAGRQAADYFFVCVDDQEEVSAHDLA
jgi:hypothetical protein